MNLHFFRNQNLNLARLPISPHPRAGSVEIIAMRDADVLLFSTTCWVRFAFLLFLGRLSGGREFFDVDRISRHAQHTRRNVGWGLGVEVSGLLIEISSDAA